MPPLDYRDLATRRDLDALRAELRGEMAELRGEMATEFAAVRVEATTNLRMMLAGQVTTTLILIGWIAANA